MLCYNITMKKSLFILFSVIFVFSSCKKDETISYEEELKNDVSLLSQNEEFDEEPNFFTSTLVKEKNEDKYFYSFVFESFKKDFDEVKALIEFKNENETKYVFFGYGLNYKIVSDKSKVDKQNNIYPGFVIYATLNYDYENVNVLFKSVDYKVYYKKNSIEK